MKKIKTALRALFSPNFIHTIEFGEALKKVGIASIKTFVQIGANDGLKNDPLREGILKYHWKGILVEPDEGNFRKLEHNYQGVSGIQLENAGIGPKEGELTFYTISNIRDNEPGWYDQVGSFDKDKFLLNVSVVDGLDARIAEKKIPVFTFDQLLLKYNFDDLDLLVIDTEGYDYRILKSIDLKKYSPRMVLFETEWMTQFELREICNYLRAYGFKLYSHQGDHIAIKSRQK